MPDTSWRVVHHTLPPPLWERLCRYATERNLSTSAVLELSLRYFLQSERERLLRELLRSAPVASD